MKANLGLIGFTLLLLLAGCSSPEQISDTSFEHNLHTNHPCEYGIFRFSELLPNGFSAVAIDGTVYEFVTVSRSDNNAIRYEDYKINDALYIRYQEDIWRSTGRNFRKVIYAIGLYPRIEGVVVEGDHLGPFISVKTVSGDTFQFNTGYGCWAPIVEIGDHVIIEFRENTLDTNPEPYYEMISYIVLPNTLSG